MNDGTLEIIPSTEGFLVAVKNGELTAYARGYSERIVGVAKAILAADCPWMPKELVGFARDIEAGRTHTIALSDWLATVPETEIATDQDRERADKVVIALRELRSILHAAFATVLRQLEQEAARLAERGGTGRLQ